MGGVYIGGRERRRELEFQFGKERITTKLRDRVRG